MMAHLRTYIPDIDECATNTTICDSRAICMNTVGSFTCTCQVGLTGDGGSGCGEETQNVPHLLVVSISSSSNTVACTDGDMRLANGSTAVAGAREGRVEMCFNGHYGTICDDRWTPYDAVVACNKLGLSSTLTCELLVFHQSLHVLHWESTVC